MNSYNHFPIYINSNLLSVQLASTVNPEYPVWYPSFHMTWTYVVLDYTLFKEHPEFYASYKLMNKKHTAYSDNFSLRVIDLTQIHLAAEEDKLYQLDY